MKEKTRKNHVEYRAGETRFRPQRSVQGLLASQRLWAQIITLKGTAKGHCPPISRFLRWRIRADAKATPAALQRSRSERKPGIAARARNQVLALSGLIRSL